jgi:hypothetical protein
LTQLSVCIQRTVFFSINGAAASFPSCNCSCPPSPLIFSRHVLIKNSHKNPPPLLSALILPSLRNH